MARDYCFTAWKVPEWNENGIRYICWGEELTKKKIVHYQGFVIFNKTCRFPKAKKLIGAGDDTHVEVRKGTRIEAREYCTKENKFVEFGQFEGHTKESLFKLPISYLKENYPEFYCRYHRGLEKMQDKGDRWRDVSVTWLHGPAGCGKTRFAMEYSSSVFKIDRPYKWWDGYDDEETILIDDVDVKDFRENRGLFLNVLDGYRLRLEVKGSHCYAKWKTVFITSNWDPGDLLLDEALNRRVTKVTGLG